MVRLKSTAAHAAVSLLLGAGFALADREPMTDVEAFTALAEEHDGFPHQNFRSSDIVGPVFQINSLNPDLVDDAPYLFIGSVYGHMHGGPMIIDSRDFTLVYADQRYENAYTSDVMIIDGERHLAFWEGGHTRGHASGFCLMYDEHYDLKYNITAQGRDGVLADMHEMTVTKDRTVIFTTYFNIPYNCSAVGGPEDTLLMDSGFQEVDIDTNEVLFDWAASEHFNITDSFAPYRAGFGVGVDSGYDFFHINSIQKTEAGNYLVSSRHLSMLTLIDGTDGHPIWMLGGHHNEFTDLSNGTATSFGWQHHARFYQNESHITMFDNHGEHTGSCDGDCRSRGLHLEIDDKEMTVRVVREYYHPQSVDAGAMGGFQSLESGNVMTAWGHTPAFVEFTYDGTPVMDVQRGKIGGGTQNDMFAYRVNKHEWQGRPSWPPSLAMDSPTGTSANATLYLSWNGATDIAKWSIFATDHPREIQKYDSFLMDVKRTGFETTIDLGHHEGARYVAAAAVDKKNEVLGSTVVYDMQTGKPFIMTSDIVSVDAPAPVEGSPEEIPSSDPETEEKEEEKENDNGDDDESSLIGSYGVIGGGIVAVAALSSLLVWFCRRRRGRTDIETTQYKPVSSDD